MTNKKIASEIAIGIILLIAIVVGWIFWVQNEESETADQAAPSVIENQQPKVNAPAEKEGVVCTQDAKLCDDGSYVSRTGPKCEFSACPSSSSIEASYKIVEVKNPQITFSFEVPEAWITETRNSGEKELTPDDKKSFLMANMQSDNEYIIGLNLNEAEKVFDKYENDLFPLASVTAKNYVSYSDMNWEQVDFNIKEGIKISEHIRDIKSTSCKDGCEACVTKIHEKYGKISDCSQQIKNECVTGEKEIAGLNSEFIKFGISSYDGVPLADKVCSGGSKYVISVDDGLVLEISKQAKTGEQFEKDFEHLIQTLQIKAL